MSTSAAPPDASSSRYFARSASSPSTPTPRSPSRTRRRRGRALPRPRRRELRPGGRSSRTGSRRPSPAPARRRASRRGPRSGPRRRAGRAGPGARLRRAVRVAVGEGVADATRRGGQRSRSSRSSFDFAPPSKRRRSTPRRLRRRYARDDRLPEVRASRGRLRGDHRPRRPHLAEREQLRLGEQQRHAQDRRGIRRLRGGDLRGAPAVEEAHEPRLLRGEPELLHPHARDDARGGAVRPGSEPSLRARGVDGADRGAGHRVRVAERKRRGRGRHARLSSSSPPRPRARARRARRRDP